MIHLLLALGATALAAQPQGPSFIAVEDTSFRSPPLDLSYVSLRVDPRQQVYLEDHLGPVLYQLRPNGDTSRTIMARGQGPGEAMQIRGFGWLGDSLWVLDGVLQRLTILPPGLRKPLTWRFDERCRTLNPWAILRDGRCLMGQPPSADRRDGAPMAVEVGRDQSVPSDTVLALSTANAYVRFRWDDGQLTIPQPFADNPLFVVAPTSDFIVVSAREAARSAGPGTFSVRVWSARTGWAPPRQYRYQPRRLNDRSRDSAVAALTRLVARQAPTSPVGTDSIRRRLYVPRYWPPVALAMVGRDSLIWLGMREDGDARVPAGHVRYRVIDITGAPVRTVVIPNAAKPIDAYGDMVWCVVLDEDDVPRIARYRLFSAGNGAMTR